MLPEGYRRNYKHFFDGMMKAVDEGVLFRGAIANGARLAAICASMTNAYDWCKENSYFFLGPSWINRFWSTAVAAGLGTVTALPFDAIRVRMHTMRPLPDGRLPYWSSYDCAKKMLNYEGSAKYSSNFNCFFAGGQAFYFRLYAICFLSQHFLDYYQGGKNVSEFWQPSRFMSQTGIDYDIHEPFLDGFNRAMNYNWTIPNQGDPNYSPDGKT